MANKPIAFYYDFNDSFSFNVIALLRDLNFEVRIFNHCDFSPEHKADLMVLGPGPGHPNDYILTEKVFEHLKRYPDQKWLGVCLGHQILGMSLGLKLIRLEQPIHGRTLPFEVPPWPIFNAALIGHKIDVQFYNSWCLKPDKLASCQLVEFNNQVFSFSNNQLLGFQFHPESVGSAFGYKLFVSDFDSVYTE
ncbi:MAG: hypothetical protein COW00_08285 [Bdellovibrio sp. CG12_big_fil_rev_8_21_14_0_65_39_13]|nr:MAG: hypothetical protein COW78_19710 [Bdellovibrio sp. CG22_combo_CG10-13_8_21_14_all_39_27]PIQ59915.1 MAG: hypothetical protein COW00_08285 [Bdellovibrio sp. CG12_big_fil_rev_8_21_14_0_65_39_13]PIR34430.1 MAG: hypothetical protein COV37_12940 [Bdellovibrio sp. CG11_big_fil_rev_8_21_14_0_20_39_38]PJB54446.1 MAG: hypothetical protein CO099_01520 [Bdellovibrio sp. CG_4_9_14_3_um_filter_39_7]